MSLTDQVLDLLRAGGDLPDVDAADLQPAEEVLLHLVRLARVDAQAPGLADLEAWLDGADDAATTPLGRSGLTAELLEALIDQRPAEAQRLAAAGPRDAGAAPFPARYTAGPWSATIGIEERGRLYVAIDAVPEGASGDAEIALAGEAASSIDLRPGAAVILGDAEAVLGAPPDFNPWSELHLVGDLVDVILVRRV